MKNLSKNTSLSAAMDDIFKSMKIEVPTIESKTETPSQNGMQYGPDGIRQIAAMVFDVQMQNGADFSPKAILQFSIFLMRSIAGLEPNDYDELNKIIYVPKNEIDGIVGTYGVFSDECDKKADENNWSEDEFGNLSALEFEVYAFHQRLADFLSEDQRYAIVSRLADVVLPLRENEELQRFTLALRIFVGCCHAFGVNADVAAAILTVAETRNNLSVFDEERETDGGRPM